MALPSERVAAPFFLPFWKSNHHCTDLFINLILSKPLRPAAVTILTAMWIQRRWSSFSRGNAERSVYPCLLPPLCVFWERGVNKPLLPLPFFPFTKHVTELKTLQIYSLRAANSSLSDVRNRLNLLRRWESIMADTSSVRSPSSSVLYFPSDCRRCAEALHLCRWCTGVKKKIYTYIQSLFITILAHLMFTQHALEQMHHFPAGSRLSEMSVSYWATRPLPVL